MKEDKSFEHPSYALAQISRVSSSKSKPLFGSSISHTQTIQLRIYRGEEIRSDSSYDRYFGREEYINVEMSNTQFAELITSMNYGVGVPVTLKHFNGIVPEDPPIRNKRAQHSQEFKEKMVKFTKTLEDGQKELQTLLNKQKLSKEDKRRMENLFQHLTTNIKNNIPYFEKAFEKQMDKTVTEAKGEVESFIANSIQLTGLEEMKKQGKMLGIENKEK